MKNIRIGNDLNVAWSIVNKQTNEPLSLEGRDIHLYLRTPFGRQSITDFSTHDNVVSWTFYGKDQKYTGKYSLELVINENEEGMATTDVCDFVNLVAHSCDVGGSDEGSVQVESVELLSSIEFDSYDDTELRESIEDLEKRKVNKTDMATINGQSIIEGGNITIKGGATPNWNAKEGEDGYIKNRTHFFNSASTVSPMAWEINNTSSPKKAIVSLSKDFIYMFEYNNNTYYIKTDTDKDANKKLVDSGALYIYYKCVSGKHTIEIQHYSQDLTNTFLVIHQQSISSAISFGYLKQLDEIFIPDTIREGASKGSTALQSVPAEYATKTDVANAIATAITNELNGDF